MVADPGMTSEARAPATSAMVSLIGAFGARLAVIEGRLVRTWFFEAAFVGLTLDVLTTGGEVGRRFFRETVHVDLSRSAEFVILALGLTVVQIRFGFLVGTFERIRHACDVLLADVKARSLPQHRTEEFDCLFKTTSLLEPYYQSQVYDTPGRRHIAGAVMGIGALTMAFNHAAVVYLMARAYPGVTGILLGLAVLVLSALCYRQYFVSLRELRTQYEGAAAPAAVVDSLDSRLRRARMFGELLLVAFATLLVAFFMRGWSP